MKRFFDPLRPPYNLKLIWVLAPCVLLGISLGLMPLRSWDFWWHIAFGRVTAATHSMPLFNHFLYTMPADAPSYVQAWLSQWALYEIHEAFGLNRILIMRTFFGVFAYLFLTLWATRRAGNAAVGAIAAWSGAVFGFFCIAARTHLLAWPLFLVVVPLMYNIRERRWPLTALIALPCLSILWTNLHGTFLIPTLVGIAFTAAEAAHLLLKRDVAGEPATKKRLGLFGLATLGSALGTLVNPRGYEVYVYLVDLPTNPINLSVITEWFPTTPFFPTFYGAYFWVIFLVALALMFKQRAKLDFVDLFLILGFGLLAIRHCRALLWVGLTLPFILPPYISFLNKHFESDEGAPSRASQALYVGVAAMMVSLVLAVQPWSTSSAPAADLQPIPTRATEPLRGLVPAETPIDAVLALKGREDLRLFHEVRYPGLLLYSLDDAEPTQMVYLDNRIELPSTDLWKQYDEISAGKGWREVFAKYDVNAVVANKETQGGLIDAMRSDADWRIEHEDEYNVLFLPKGAP